MTAPRKAFLSLLLAALNFMLAAFTFSIGLFMTATLATIVGFGALVQALRLGLFGRGT